MSLVVSSMRGHGEPAHDGTEDETKKQIEDRPRRAKDNVEKYERPELVGDDGNDERRKDGGGDRNARPRHDLEIWSWHGHRRSRVRIGVWNAHYSVRHAAILDPWWLTVKHDATGGVSSGAAPMPAMPLPILTRRP